MVINYAMAINIVLKQARNGISLGMNTTNSILSREETTISLPLTFVINPSSPLIKMKTTKTIHIKNQKNYDNISYQIILGIRLNNKVY